MIKIYEEKCKGCELCIIACPKKILKLSESRVNKQGYHPVFITSQEDCTGCGLCAEMCPDVCIEVYR